MNKNGVFLKDVGGGLREALLGLSFSGKITNISSKSNMNSYLFMILNIEKYYWQLVPNVL